MNKNYISILDGNICKQVLLISYTKDGGFFIKDLMRLKENNKLCGIFKIKTDTQNNGTRDISPHYKSYTKGDVKLTHHFDGKVHISGKGIISGYNQDGTPKGASVQSIKLTESNDGGPIFNILFWGPSDICRNGNKKDILLSPTYREKFSDTQGPYKGIVIEGFYILKDWIIPGKQTPSEYINFYSPIEGKSIVRIIPSPKDHPGALCLTCSYINHNNINPYGFTMGGGPGIIYDEHFCDMLSIIYPQENIHEDSENLDYKL